MGEISMMKQTIYVALRKLVSVINLFAYLLICGCSDKSIDQGNSNTVDASFYHKDSIHHGEATFYGIAGVGGNCMLPSPSPWDTMAGAMNHVDYRNSEICGACVMVTGPLDSVLIRINDQCPECKEGDIDLTPNAFRRIGPIELGRMPISWHFVPCPVEGNLQLYYPAGSTVYWAGIQVRNHRNPVRSMAYLLDNKWVDIARKPYNRFEMTAMPIPPWALRIRDVFDNEVVDSAVPLLDSAEYGISAQFPEPGEE